jgi:hypothetical protein
LLVADGEIAITQAADLDAGWMLELLGIPVSARVASVRWCR